MDQQLREIIEMALSKDPRLRHQDASELAEKLRAYLDGTAQAAVAQQKLHQAAAIADQRRALQSKLLADDEEVFAIRSQVPPWAPVQEKAQLWQLEDKLVGDRGRARALAGEELRLLHEARFLAPALPETDDAMARYHRDMQEAAEKSGDQHAASSHLEELARYDRAGAYAEYIRGKAAVTLITEPSHARVRLFRFVERDRQLVPVPERLYADAQADEREADQLQTPLLRHPVDAGSYVFEISAEGHETIRYPFCVRRGEHWDGVPPGETEPQVIHLPPSGELLGDEVYVPPGWFTAGGDPLAVDSVYEKRLWLDGFVIYKFPVLVKDYISWLQRLSDGGETALARQHYPLSRTGTEADLDQLLGDGVIKNNKDQWKDIWGDDFPIALVSWHDALAFARRRASELGRPYRLPSEWEIEKAGRGVDKRFFPFGNYPEPTWSRCSEAIHPDLKAGPCSVSLYPKDESLYGVRHLAGLARDWCLEPYDAPVPAAGERVIIPTAENPGRYQRLRGGSASKPPGDGRMAARLVAPPSDRAHSYTFRLARSWPC